MLPPRTAVANSVQSFPPPNSVGAGPFLFEVSRGPILPPRGTKQRDMQLRYYDNYSYSSMWQGARSGIQKKIAGVGFTVNGPPAKAQYFQDLLGYSHFGKGYEYLINLFVRDYLTQSYGGIFEIAGPGDPTTELLEAPTGLNHLDSGRCYVTGNPVFPILYYSLWDGKLHKMHASRVYMIVDDPDPDERFLGIGTSAFERAIAINQRELRMGQYIDTLLDDKPQPGLLSLTGVSDPNWQGLVTKYIAETNNDQLGPFGRTMVLTSLDPNAAVKAEVVPFSQTPEKFDFTKYTDLDVSALALALGVDRQELWELAGRGLGSGSQSAVLSMKSRAKLYGSILSQLERFFNWSFLPKDCEFEFVEDDPLHDTTQAAIDLQIAQIAQVMAAIPGISPLEIKTFLAHRSDSFKDALTDEQGRINVSSVDPATVAQANEPQIDNATPTAAIAPATGGGQQPSPRPGVPTGQLVAAQAKKGLETEGQRAWFFANNPEYSSGATSGDSDNPAKAPRAAQGIVSEGETLEAPNELANIVKPEMSSSAPKTGSSDNPAKSPTITSQSGSDILGNRHVFQRRVLEAMSRHGGDISLSQLAKRLSDRSAMGSGDVPFVVKSLIKDGLVEQVGTTTIVPSGTKPRSQPVYRLTANGRLAGAEQVRRLDAVGNKAVKGFSTTSADFENHFADIVDRAVNGRIKRSQAEGLLLGLLLSSGTKAFQDGLASGGVSDMDEDDQSTVQDWVSDSIDYLDPFLDTAFDGTLAVGQVSAHAEMWSNKSLTDIYNQGRISADKNGYYVWKLGATEQHCPDCQRLAGQVHRFKEYYSRNWLPQGDNLACGGYRCDCRLDKASGPGQGRF